MQISRETILGRRNGIEQHDGADLAAMTRAVGDHMHEHLLASHPAELRVDDLELASFVCVTSIEALTHNAVLHYSGMLSDPAMEALIDEGTRLVTGYLKR
jgi:hypothetical protein